MCVFVALHVHNDFGAVAGEKHDTLSTNNLQCKLFPLEHYWHMCTLNIINNYGWGYVDGTFHCLF